MILLAVCGCYFDIGAPVKSESASGYGPENVVSITASYTSITDTFSSPGYCSWYKIEASAGDSFSFGVDAACLTLDSTFLPANYIILSILPPSVDTVYYSGYFWAEATSPKTFVMKQAGSYYVLLNLYHPVECTYTLSVYRHTKS